MDILTIPNKILTAKAEEVKDFSGMGNLVAEMIDTAKNAGLVGLAGNQVGILKRVFIMDTSSQSGNYEGEYIPNFQAFVNPTIKVNRTNGQEFGFEGCGSVPRTHCVVERWKTLTITAYNVQGESFTMELSGLLARIAQHELNHLDGILMTSKARQIIRK